MGWTTHPPSAQSNGAIFDNAGYYNNSYNSNPMSTVPPQHILPADSAAGVGSTAEDRENAYSIQNYPHNSQPSRDRNLYPAYLAAAAHVPVTAASSSSVLQTISQQQQQQQQQQPSSLYNIRYEGDYLNLNATSNRMQRNFAEKMRRDKLNMFINELAALVPMVSNSPKRMDKTSVLRLSASFLRMHQLREAVKDEQNQLPQVLNSTNWPQSLLDEMDGVMLIVTSEGKIVFISHNIEKVLGHTQVELFGFSLFNITFPPDHGELKRCLAPDEEADGDDGVGGTGCDSDNGANRVEMQRRSFCLRLRHRCLARSEQPQYESMHIVGHLRVPKKFTSQVQKKSRKSKVDIAATNSDEIRLVAVMKPAREISLMSIMEASQEEYVTRHLCDGRIIYTDHRISQVSGYLPEEVSGLTAFNFMHIEEVRWVIIALRQMLWNREGFEKSCYRLKTKTGDFIYMKTYGYLEPGEDVQRSTLVCVNTLVSVEEGEREIQNMKRRFSPLIKEQSEPAIKAIAQKHTSTENEEDHVPKTEDPAELRCAIKEMIKNLPPLVQIKEDPQKSKETQFAKAKFISKTFLPPSCIPGSKVVTLVEDRSTAQRDCLSPLSSTATPSTHCMQPRSVSPAVAPSSPSVPSRTLQNRPSVLRIAPSRQSATAAYPNPIDSCHITSTSSSDNESAAAATDNSRHENAADHKSRTFVKNRTSATKSDFIKQECIKQEAVDIDEFEELETRLVARAGVVQRLDSISNDCIDQSDQTAGVVVRRSAIKRHFDFEASSFASTVPTKKNALNVDLTSSTANHLHSYQNPLHVNNVAQLSPHQTSYNRDLCFSLLNRDGNSVNDATASQFHQFTQLSVIEECDPTTQLVDLDTFAAKTEPEEVLQLLDNEELKNSHLKLESKIHMQGAQIHDIEGDLNTVPFTSEQRDLHSGLTELKEQHFKQEKMLRTLRQDHHSLQHCSPDTACLNSKHADINV